MIKQYLPILLLGSLLAATPALAISPSVAVPRSASTGVSMSSANADSVANDNSGARVTADAHTAAHCREEHSRFRSRNSRSPSARRKAIEECENALDIAPTDSTPPASTP